MNCIHCETEVSVYPLTCKTCGKELCDTCHKALKGECEKCKVGKIPEVWRRSWLTLYEKCPYACYKTAIEGIESKGNVWSVVGNILHDIFEDASNNKLAQEYDVLWARYERELDEFKSREPQMFKDAQSLVKGDITGKMRERGRLSIRSYLTYESESPNPISTEVKYFLQIPGCPKISATIDRVNPIVGGSHAGVHKDGGSNTGDGGSDKSKPGSVEIVDYKTGKCFYGAQLKNDLQVPIYILAYQQTTGVLPDRFTFLFVEEGKSRTFVRIDDDKYVCKVIKNEYVISLQETQRRIKTMFARVYKGQWGIPNKINSFFCGNFCDVAKLGHCSGKDNQQWENLRINLK